MLHVVTVRLLGYVALLIRGRHVVIIDGRQVRAVLVGRHRVCGRHGAWLIIVLGYVGRGGPREGLTRVHYLCEGSVRRRASKLRASDDGEERMEGVMSQVGCA
jgi:hypothetical protein